MSFSLVPGFGPGGAINFTLSGFQLHTLFDREKQAGHAPDVHNMGIMITTPFGGVIMEEEVIEKSLCPLDSQEQITLMRFDEIETGDAVVERSFVLADMLEQYRGGEFILYFANCEFNTAVDFDIQLALFNQKGQKVDYLPVGMDALPLLYFIAFIVFTTLAVLWTLTVLRAKQGAHTIHWLMLGLVVLRALTVLSQSGMYHMVGTDLGRRAPARPDPLTRATRFARSLARSPSSATPRAGTSHFTSLPPSGACSSSPWWSSSRRAGAT